MLADSLYILAMAAESNADAFAWKELDRLAAAHSRTGLDINPRHYDAWLDCLVTAAGIYDPQFTPEIKRAWQDALTPGIRHLSAKY